MSLAQHTTQLFIHAIRAAVHIAGGRAQVEHGKTKLNALEMQLAHDEKAIEEHHLHEKEMFALKANLVRDLVKALIERRIDAVVQGFSQTRSMYAEQSRHFMAQQERFAEAKIKATGLQERADYHARLVEIDVQLESIRADAALLDREMAKALLLIGGGSMPALSIEDQRALNF
jgi:hypothetical protein